MEPRVLAERYEDRSCGHLVNASDCLGHSLCEVAFDPHMIWVRVGDEECERYPKVDRHVLFRCNVWHHVPLQMVDCIQKLLSSGHTFEAVDVDDRSSVTHFIEPVLDVGRSLAFELHL